MDLTFEQIGQQMRLEKVMRDRVYGDLDDEKGRENAGAAVMRLSATLPEPLYKEVLQDPTTLSKKAPEISRAIADHIKEFAKGEFPEGPPSKALTEWRELQTRLQNAIKDGKLDQIETAPSAPDMPAAGTSPTPNLPPPDRSASEPFPKR